MTMSLWEHAESFPLLGKKLQAALTCCDLVKMICKTSSKHLPVEARSRYGAGLGGKWSGPNRTAGVETGDNSVVTQPSAHC